MTENFRSYMDHLSHLTTDADPTRRLGAEVEEQTRWGDNVVEMCSDVSDSEDCPVDHYSDRDHLQRNPNFPYESLASPRVAWGERPREAWNDDVSEPHHMFDSTNPYALFNLPHPGLRGNIHHHRRKPIGLSHVNRDDKTARQEVIRRKNGTHSGRIGEPTRAGASHFNLGENQSVLDCRQTSQPNFDCDSHSSVVCENFRRRRQPQFGAPEVQPKINNRCSLPLPESEVVLPKERVVIDESSVRDTYHITRDSQQASTSAALIAPRFSSQESMDTTSDSEESSDIDIITVPHLHHSHDSNANPCSAHREKNNTIVRPKAIKGELNGQFDRTSSEKTLSGQCCKTSPQTSSSVSPDHHRVSPNLGIPLPGLSASDYRSSEARVLHMDTHQHCVVQPQPCHIKNMSNKKSHKDKHNSVIKCKGTPTRSIDLTDSEVDSGRFTEQDAAARASSPIIQDVHLGSASDDSDIEVVKIETSRYASCSELTLNAPIAIIVVYFSRLLKCLRSLYGKQCGPRSDCSYRSSLFWFHAVCFYT